MVNEFGIFLVLFLILLCLALSLLLDSSLAISFSICSCVSLEVRILTLIPCRLTASFNNFIITCACSSSLRNKPAAGESNNREFLVRVHEHVVDFQSSRLEGDSFEWFSFSIFFQLRTHRMHNNNAPMQIFAFGKTCKQVANGG